MVVLIFGDSITQGYWDDDGGWADRIKRHVMDADIKRGYKGYHGVFNLGVDGNFTHDVVERLDGETKARRFAKADKNSDYAILFAIGVNDSLHRGKGYQSTPEKYSDELEALYQKARKLTVRVAFINLLPIDEDAEDQATGNKDLFYTNQRIGLFNDVLEKFCKDNELLMIDAKSSFIDNYELFSPDGTHPNTKGHEEIYNLALPTVKMWLYNS